MAYGHAERTLAAIRHLEAQTRELLGSLAQLDPEQSHWLHEVAEAGSQAGDAPAPGGPPENKRPDDGGRRWA
jgi:hypothetical protein